MTEHCGIENCEKAVRAKGLCVGHYERSRLGRPSDHPIRSFIKAADQGTCHCGEMAWRKHLCRSHYHAKQRASVPLERRRIAFRAHNLRKKFQITVEQYEALLSEQGGVCAICRRPCKTGKRLAVDHDHATGTVRGLLCTPCNTAIGLVAESTERLYVMAAYLTKKWK